MNNIYIINDNDEYLISLNFINNSFILNEVEYKFDICNNDEINIFWTEDNFKKYYTKDSYLYFYNLEFIDTIKIIYLIHNDWHDQALINFKTKSLNRIKNNDQFGVFDINENEFVINWNYWGLEKYNKFGENIYIQQNYNYIQSINHINIIPIHIFIHICAIENWKEIFKELIFEIKNSGLYSLVDTIHIGILGNIDIINDTIFHDKKFNIIFINKKINLYENITINYIKSFCEESDEKEIYILYLHTKGVRRAGNEQVIKSWRQMMEYFLIGEYKYCINLLNNYNTLGNNVVNSYIFEKENVSISDKHTLHYSGNYWWSKKSYINTLPYINIDFSKDSFKSRFKSENWILSNFEQNSKKFGILFQDYTNTHPYHRSIFDNYKNEKLIVKNIYL